MSVASSDAFSGVLTSARCGVTGSVISSVVGMYCTANLFAGCADGGAEEALGRGKSFLGSARSVEVCCTSSGKRCIVGGSSLLLS